MWLNFWEFVGEKMATCTTGADMLIMVESVVKI